MREKKEFSIFSFSKQGEAIKLESILKGQNLGRIIPTPGQVSAGCGFSWRTSPDLEAQVLDIIKNNNISYDKITRLMMY